MLVAGRGGRQSITKGMAKWKGTEITRDISQSSGQFRLATAVLFPLWSTLFIDLFFDFFLSLCPLLRVVLQHVDDHQSHLKFFLSVDYVTGIVHRGESRACCGTGGRRLTLNEKETTKDDDDHQTI